jgi:hypothetical protein
MSYFFLLPSIPNSFKSNIVNHFSSKHKLVGGHLNSCGIGASHSRCCILEQNSNGLPSFKLSFFQSNDAIIAFTFWCACSVTFYMYIVICS